MILDDTRESMRRSERGGERGMERPRLRYDDPPRRLRELEDEAYVKHGKRRRRVSPRERSPGVVDHFEGR